MVKKNVDIAPKEIPSEWGDRDEFKWDNLGRSRRLQRKAEELIINSCPIEIGKAESLIRYKLGISGRRITNEFIIPLIDMGIISLKDGKLYAINKLINVKDIKLCDVCGYKEPNEKCLENKCKNLIEEGGESRSQLSPP